MGSAASKRQDYLVQTIDEHESCINCMALSLDKTVLATGSDDNTIRLWSTKTDLIECLNIFSGHTDYITDLIIYENYIISSSSDQTIRKWDMMSGECLFICTGHTSLVNRILTTSNYIFSTSYDRTARCWDINNGQCIRIFCGHNHGLLPILFVQSNDDTNDENEFENEMNIYTKDLVITGSQDTTAKIWSFETGDCLKTLEGHIGAVLCLAKDALEKILFTGSGDHTIRVWDIRRGEELRIYDQHQGPIINLLVGTN